MFTGQCPETVILRVASGSGRRYSSSVDLDRRGRAAFEFMPGKRNPVIGFPVAVIVFIASSMLEGKP
jgi:hypothetical protein